MATRTTSITSYNPSVSEIQSGLLAKSASIRTNLTNIETPLDQGKPLIESMWESLGAIERVTFVKSFDDAKVTPGTNSIDIDTGATTLGEVDSNYTVTERDGWASASLSVTGITSGIVWAIYPGLTYTATNDLPASKPANAYRVLTFTNSGGTVTVNAKSFQKAIESDTNILESTIEFKGKVTNNYPRLSAAVASNALTITLSGGSFSFRSSSLTSGLLTTLAVSSALTLTIPASTTIGSIANDTRYLHVYAINNAGTIELAVSMAGYINCDILQSTTAISGGTSPSTLYSTTARSNVAVVYLGKILASQSTAGTWASAPTIITVCPQEKKGRVLIDVRVASSSATVNFTDFPSYFSRYTIDCENVAPATDAQGLVYRTSTDGGSTYTSSASSYTGAIQAWSSSAASFGGGAATSGTLSGAVGNAANETLAGSIEIYNLRNSGTRTKAVCFGAYNGADGVIRGNAVGSERVANEDNNALQLLFASGNIATGTFKLYGVY